ncbi:MAG: nucleotide disphospho-sugar-binding domain-containing protein [Pseudomonadota bacterium]
MVRFLIVTVGVNIRLNADFEFSRRLGSLNYETAVACQNTAIEDDVVNAGFRFLPLKAHTEPALFPGILKQLLNRRAFRSTVAAKNALLRDGAGLNDHIDEFDPDLIFLDSECHELVIVALKSGKKVALLETHVSTLRFRGVPPLSSSLIPDASYLSKLKAAWSWKVLGWRRLAGKVWRRLVLADHSKHSNLKRMVRENGLDWDGWISESQWQYYFFNELHYLCFCAPEFDFVYPPSRKNLHYLGPMVSADPPKYTYEFKTQWKRWTFKDSHWPLVVVSSGSILRRTDFCAALCRAVADKQVRVVMNYSGQDLAALGSVPENVLISTWIPQRRLLKEASLCIGHGGSATTRESLYHGVPLLVYSAGVMDMNGNGARVAHHGLGVFRTRYTDKIISSDVDQVIGDPRYLSRAKDFAATLKHYDDPEILGHVMSQVMGV